MKTLKWADLRVIGTTDNGNRWHPNREIASYFDAVRWPSRAWPHSYARAAQTEKFAKWLLANHAQLAEKLGLVA